MPGFGEFRRYAEPGVSQSAGSYAGFGEFRRYVETGEEAGSFESCAAKFVKRFGFVVFFVLFTLIFYAAFGEDVTFALLVLVLLSIIYVNFDKLENFVKKLRG